MNFKIGDAVGKVGGEYRFDGRVVAIFQKRSGETRLVVEDDFHSSLHIFSEKNLKHRAIEFQHVLDWLANENAIVFDADAIGVDYPSERLEELMESFGRDKYTSELKDTFRLDKDHIEYFTKTLGGTLPTGCTKIVIGILNNGKYVMGAY